MAILKIKQNGEWVEKFIKHDASISDLENYYLKSQTYTKEEVNALISGTISFIVVDTLPTASAETMRDIYLVPSSSSKVQNVKDEFITIENSGSYSWEQIGSTAIDLSQYYTKTETNALLDTKANSSDVYNKTEVNSLLGGKQNTLIAGENITIQDNVISASSGSGGISVFKVTFTADESEEDKLVADKTAKEIYDAYTSGKIVMGECGDLKDLPLTWLNYSNEEYEITFVYNGADVVTHNQLYQEQFDLIGMEASSNIYLMKSAVCNDVSVSSTGTSTDEISYITINDTEYKIASGGSGSSDLIVNITYTPSATEGEIGTFSADKTYTEIKTAYNAGTFVWAKGNKILAVDGEDSDVFDVNYCIPLNTVDAIDTGIQFNGQYFGSGSCPIIVDINDDDTVEAALFAQSGGGSGHTYSTTEQLTNDVWIDGKSIYEKVDTTPVSNTGINLIETNASDFTTDGICAEYWTIDTTNHKITYSGNQSGYAKLRCNFHLSTAISGTKLKINYNITVSANPDYSYVIPFDDNGTELVSHRGELNLTVGQHTYEIDLDDYTDTDYITLLLQVTTHTNSQLTFEITSFEYIVPIYDTIIKSELIGSGTYYINRYTKTSS